MRRALLLLLLIPFFACLSQAQFVTVKATVSDRNNHLYANCSWNVTFTGDPASTLNGSAFDQSFSGTCTPDAYMALTLPQNSQIHPLGSQWTFQFCNSTGVFCASTPLTVGNSDPQDVSVSLRSVAPVLPSILPYLDLVANLSNPSNPDYGSARIFYNQNTARVEAIDPSGVNVLFGGGGGGGVSSIATTAPIVGGPITSTGTISCPACALGPGTSVAGHFAIFSGTNGLTLADGGGSPGGVVLLAPTGDQTITGAYALNLSDAASTLNAAGNFHSGIPFSSLSSLAQSDIFPTSFFPANVFSEGGASTAGSIQAVSDWTQFGQSAISGVGVVDLSADQTGFTGTLGATYGVFVNLNGHTTDTGFSGSYAIGSQAETSVTGPGTIGNTAGFFAGGNSATGSPTVGVNAAFMAAANTAALGGGTINAQFYGFDQGAGATDYGIYLAGSTHNYLGTGLTQAGSFVTGTDNSSAGSVTIANGSANAHTIIASGATTTNTIKGFATVPTTGHVVTCTTSGTTCTLTDGGVIASGGTVTSVATNSPITGGTITGTGTIACATCVTSSSPGVGIAHFAGSTQAVTSSLIVAADITSATITGTQLAASLALTTPNIGVASGTSLAVTSSLSGATYLTATKCAAAGTAANPSVVTCSAAPSGSFSCATNASTGTCTVNTSAVTASSAILVQPDSSLSTLLSVTCNTTADTGLTAPRVSARAGGTSFTITLGTFATNPLCYNYWIVN